MLTAVSGRYNNTVTNVYNAAGQTTSESLAISSKTYTTAYEYNAIGQRTKLTYPDTTIVERTYHATRQLHQVKVNGTVVDTRTYDAGMRLTQSTYGNGVVTDWSYFDDNLVESIDINDAFSNSLDTFDYTYDANKNVVSETRSGVMAGYSWTTDNNLPGGGVASGYDAEDRLTHWQHTGTNPTTHDWNLSLVGDWNSFTDTGTTQTRTHTDVHEIASITESGSTTNLAHDVKGNLVTNLDGDQYTWDFDNRLVSADTDSDPDPEISFEYDALGRRVKVSGTSYSRVYVYSNQQIIVRYNNGANPTVPQRRFIYASYIDEPIIYERKVAAFGNVITTTATANTRSAY